MYKHTLAVHGEYLAKDHDLPQNASEDGNGAVLDVSGSLGGVEVVAEAAAEITLADTKTLTISLEHKDDADAAYVALGTVYGLTSDGGDTIAAGTELGRFVPPSDVKENLKAVLATDDAAASGKVSVYTSYLAR